MIKDLASGTLEARATLVTCRVMPAPRRESNASPFWNFLQTRFSGDCAIGGGCPPVPSVDVGLVLFS